MTQKFALDRRAALAGGTALALVGCGQQSGSSSFDSDDVGFVLEELGFYLTIGALMTTGGAAVAGVIGLVKVARNLRRLSTFINRADRVVDALNMVFSIPSARAATMQPSPFYRPSNTLVNTSSEVPILGMTVDLDLSMAAQGGFDTSRHVVHTSVLPASRGAPKTVAQAMSGGDFPFARTRPATDPKFWNQKLRVRLPQPDAYAYYCWILPRGQDLTDDIVANDAFVGQPFIAMSDADRRVISDEITSGVTVQKSFFVPA